jgi:hypothetical protein
VPRLNCFEAVVHPAECYRIVSVLACRQVEVEESQLQFSMRDESDNITNSPAIAERIPRDRLNFPCQFADRVFPRSGPQRNADISSQ